LRRTTAKSSLRRPGKDRFSTLDRFSVGDEVQVGVVRNSGSCEVITLMSALE
jgi:hypothetical protein